MANALILPHNVNPQSPWEKWPSETTKSYAAFLTYRNLPGWKRSIAKAVVAQFGKWSDSKQTIWERWSSKYNWVARASLWDEEVERELREKEIQHLTEMRLRHTKISQALQQKAIERLKNLDAKDLTVAELLRFIEQGTNLERLTIGEPTQILENNVINTLAVEIDFSKKTDAELRLLVEKAKLSSVN